MLSDSPNNNIILNPFVCLICNIVPEIVEIHEELGKIILKCNCGPNKEWDIYQYIQKLEQERKISSNSFKKESDQSLDDNSDDNIIKESAKNISDIIRINQLIDLTQRKYPNNYYHNMSLINLGKSIEKEYETPMNINQTINSVLKSKKALDDEKKAIQNLESLSVFIDNKVENLLLKGEPVEKNYKWLRDKGFEYISKIRFKHLIEINLSNNGITSVTYLNNMLLPHLKYLNLSNNLIMDIKPVAELLSEHMKEILLQDNQIDDIIDFKNSNFNELTLLRVDKNNINFKSKNFTDVLKKYGKKLFYKNIDFKEFNAKYNCNIDGNSQKVDLSSKSQGDIILTDFYCLINSNNFIKYLLLDDNKLQNPSILNRIPLRRLQILDLSLNLIVDIKFLKKLSKKCKLQKLYLNDNKIKDLSPLINYSTMADVDSLIFKELHCLTLKNNYFYEKKNELHFINKETLQIAKFIAEKLKDGFDFDLKEIKEEENRLNKKDEEKFNRVYLGENNTNENNANNFFLNDNN